MQPIEAVLQPCASFWHANGAEAPERFALVCGKIVACDDQDRFWTPGVVVVSDGLDAAL